MAKDLVIQSELFTIIIKNLEIISREEISYDSIKIKSKIPKTQLAEILDKIMLEL